jgi:hypothetical protein
MIMQTFIAEVGVEKHDCKGEKHLCNFCHICLLNEIDVTFHLVYFVLSAMSCVLCLCVV